MAKQETTPLESNLENNEISVIGHVTTTMEEDSKMPISIASDSSESSFLSPVSFDNTIEFGTQEETAEIAPVALVSETQEVSMVAVDTEETLAEDVVATDEVEAEDVVVALETEEAPAEEMVATEEVEAEEIVVALETEEAPAEEMVATEEVEAEEVVVALETEEAPAEEIVATEAVEVEEVAVALEMLDEPAANTTIMSDVLLDADSIPGLDVDGEEAVVTTDTSSSHSFVDYVWGFFHNPFASDVVEDTNSTDVIV